ncbi:MAG: hypothetical protein ABIP39_07245 [Polyangiaceae bacterium]
MSNGRRDARQRGWRMAAKIAAIGGLALTAGGTAHALGEPARAMASGSSEESSKLPLEDWVRVQNMKSGGCMPSWGPPAPPVRSARRRTKRGRR